MSTNDASVPDVDVADQRREDGSGPRLRTGVVRYPAAWWSNFTSGQQWTAGLLVLLAALVVSFGLPPAYRIAPGLDAAASPATQEVTEVPAPDPGGPAGEAVTFSDGTPLGRPPVLDRSAPPAVIDQPGVTVVAAERPRVVLVVRRAGVVPGRDDADIAAAFLARARFDAEMIELEGAGSCDEIAALGEVVVSGAGLPAELRDCLVQREKILIAYDALGGVQPAAGRGQVLSTSRGAVASLLDLASWAVTAGKLPAQTGLVASESLRDEVEPAVAALAGIGVTFPTTHFVADGPLSTLGIIEALGQFSDAGIRTVLFAADVVHQRRWVELETVTGTTFDHLVSDLGDGIVTEDYPSSFAGALAHTSLRFPWFEREHGPTAEQARCREEWEAAAPPGPSGGAAETALAYTWCLHLWHIVEPALDAVDAGTPFASALRSGIVSSPLTSPLATLTDGSYGPVRDYVLEWDGACGCWASRGEADRHTG